MAKKNKSRISKRIGNILFWSFYGFVVGLSYFITQNISVNGFIPTETTLNILKALVDVNIALLGFWGLILVFSLNSLRETKGRVERERHELAIAKDRLILDRDIRFANDVKKLVADAFGRLEKRYEKRITELDDQLQQLATQISYMIIGAFGVAVMLVWGLVQSVTAMGKIGRQGLYFVDVFWCLVIILMAVFLIFSSLWSSRPEPERRVIMERLEKGWGKLRKEQRRTWAKSRKEGEERAVYCVKVFEKKLEPFIRKMQDLRKRARQKQKKK